MVLNEIYKTSNFTISIFYKFIREKNMLNSLVVQLVEQSPEKACVAGLIPTQTTSI